VKVRFLRLESVAAMLKDPVIEHQGGLKEYDYRKPLQDILLLSIVAYLITFAFTWYHIWWDTLIALIFVCLGYYSIWDKNSTPEGKCFNIVRNLLLLSLIYRFEMLTLLLRFVL